MEILLSRSGNDRNSDRTGIRRLLIITDLFPRYISDVRGIYILDYIRAMAEEYEIIVLNPALENPARKEENAWDDHFILLRSRAFHARGNPLLKAIGYAVLIGRAVAAGFSVRQCHVIHAHGVIIPGIIGTMLSRMLHAPLVITEHTGPYSVISSRSSVRRIAGWTLKHARMVTVVSNHLKNELQAAHGEELEVSVIGNPVDTEVFRYDGTVRRKSILFVGRLDEDKGLYESLDALLGIEHQWTQWTYDIIGDGPARKRLEVSLKEKYAKIAPRVRLLGWKSRNEVVCMMNSAAFLLHLSRHESFGITIVEAISCGLPVVGGANSAMLETVDPRAGILVDVSNQEKIVQGISRMLLAWASYDRSWMHSYVESRFGYDVFRGKLRSTYEEVIS